jgi:hypothetical protein
MFGRERSTISRLLKRMGLQSLPVKVGSKKVKPESMEYKPVLGDDLTNKGNVKLDTRLGGDSIHPLWMVIDRNPKWYSFIEMED